jgi:hypothetical protein
MSQVNCPFTVRLRGVKKNWRMPRQGHSPEAARELDLAVKLVLDLLTVIVGASDRFW